MRSEYEAYSAMSSEATAKRKYVSSDDTDWAMAQTVDDALDALRHGRIHADVDAYMIERFVPEQVRRRVLAGHAVQRHGVRRGYHV